MYIKKGKVGSGGGGEGDHIYIPTDAACCPDINIEDVVLLNKIGPRRDSRKYFIYTEFSGLGFKAFRF